MKHPIARAAWLLAFIGSFAVAAPTLQGGSISGEVAQTQNVGDYTYLRLKTPEGEVWAAVTKAAIKDGAKVTIGNASMMENFHSKGLNRTFDRIVFGQLVDPAGPTAATAAKQAAPAAAAKPAEPVAKAKGSDARTVAEVVKGRAALRDKTVTVHARVVKVNLHIMGKNWLHLQDGSGAAADGSNDILATTQDTAAVGDVVTVKGVVRNDVNLGGGYEYAVMIDGASIAK